MLPLALWGVGWALFNAPNQSATFGAVTHDKLGAAAGMIATTARTGSAMGVALAATLFSTLLSAAGLSPEQTQYDRGEERRQEDGEGHRRGATRGEEPQ
jgi:hypothetical protein